MDNFVVVIPAMNEERSIANVLKDIQSLHNCDIIVVDDASTDNTAQVARDQGAIVLPHVTNLGAWRATQTGIRYALKFGYDRVVTFDADGQHKAEFIGPLLETSRQGYDLVVGSCTSRGSLGRHIAWAVFKRLTGVAISDLTSGFRCYSKNAVRLLASRHATMFEYQDVGVLLLLSHLKMSSKEIDVKMIGRSNGISRIFNSWFSVFKYLLYTLILSVTKAMPVKPENYYKNLNTGESVD